MSLETLETGKTLKGYEVQALVAEGGQGQIYRAYQPVLEREVALKVSGQNMPITPTSFAVLRWKRR